MLIKLQLKKYRDFFKLNVIHNAIKRIRHNNGLQTRPTLNFSIISYETFSLAGCTGQPRLTE
jgi:hypothetical protein